MDFIGEYEVNLDAKGRFQFPVAFRRQLGENDCVFILKQGLERCLSLVPRAKWLMLMGVVNRMNNFDPKVRDFKRKFAKGAIETELDGTGRILIPKNLAAYAGLEKEIVINSLGDELEIWDKTYYQQYTQCDPETFSRLANEVMVGIEELKNKSII